VDHARFPFLLDVTEVPHNDRDGPRRGDAPTMMKPAVCDVEVGEEIEEGSFEVEFRPISPINSIVPMKRAQRLTNRVIVSCRTPCEWASRSPVIAASS